MQRFYPYKWLEEEAQTSDNTTFTKIFPSEGQVSALQMEMKATNGATSNIANLLPECVSSIEIKGDGVDTILSLDGYALWKYLWAIHGRCPVGSYTEHPGDGQWMKFVFPFGRWVGDQEYMLNLDKYHEVRLDVKYNLATNTAVGATGFVTGTFGLKLDLLKTLPGIKLVSKGCRRVIERKSFTTTSSGDISWDFVQDYPYTAVMPYARFISMYGDPFAKIKLDLGGGKPILVDRRFDELSYIMADEMNIDTTFIGKYFVKDNDTIVTHGGGNYDCSPVVFNVNSDVDPWYVVHPELWGGDMVKLGVATFAGAAAPASLGDGIRITARSKHFGLGSLLYIPLCDGPEWTNPLLPADTKDAQLIMTQSEASATGKVLTEQILPQ